MRQLLCYVLYCLAVFALTSASYYFLGLTSFSNGELPCGGCV